MRGGPQSQKPQELLPTLAEDNLLDIPHHLALAQSLGKGGAESADGSGTSNRKFKGFWKATSTHLSIKLRSCSRQDLVSRAPATPGVVAIQALRYFLR